MCKAASIILMVLLLIACQNNNKFFSGYIDADLVYLSGSFNGRLVKLAVTRGQTVKQHQFLFRLEQTSELYQVAISQLSYKNLLAQRAQTLADINYNESNYRRILHMRQHNAASQNDLEVAKKDLSVSKDQLTAINAQIKSSIVDTADKKWVVKQKEGDALTPGLVFDTYYTQGEFVPAGYPVLSMVTQDNIKAVFFAPEKQLSHIYLHEKVNITTDSNSKFATGYIAYIANIAEYTPPILYSREERQQLVFRVEVKINAPELVKIHLGQPVTVELIP